jgi:hypothetical protein
VGGLHPKLNPYPINIVIGLFFIFIICGGVGSRDFARRGRGERRGLWRRSGIIEEIFCTQRTQRIMEEE